MVPSPAVQPGLPYWRVSRVGLVLGGGGAVGHGFHNGLLAAMQATIGFDARSATIIVGTSSGATIAGLVRAGLTGSDLAGRACGEAASARLQRIDARRARPAHTPPARSGAFRLRLIVPASPRGAWAASRTSGGARLGTMIGALLPEGAVPTVSTAGPLHNLFPRGWPSAALWIPAVGIDDGERVIFGRRGAPVTDVATAVAASCALPGWFAPVVVDDRRYIDGAMWSATNADVLASEALDVVSISAPLSGSSSVLHRWQRRRLRDEARQLRAAGTTVIAVEPTPADAAAMGIDIMNKKRRAAVTRHVRSAMVERLQRGDLAELGELVAGR